MKCPTCSGNLVTHSEREVQLEVCEKCNGMWLEHGELNKVEKRTSGDIEYCSVDSADHAETHPERNCPKCADQPMAKINFLEHSDILMDLCPECDGIWLDGGELKSIDDYVNKIEAASKWVKESFGAKVFRFLCAFKVS